MSGLDFSARALAVQQRTKIARNRLASRLRPSIGRYETPALVPCVIEGLAQWGSGVSVSKGDFRAVDAQVYICLKNGTTGNQAPSGTGPYIRDDSASSGTFWACFGYLAPVAAVNSLALVKGQMFISNGLIYQASTAGSLHSSNPLPSDPASGTHGTVTYTYIGRQQLPAVSMVQPVAWANNTAFTAGQYFIYADQTYVVTASGTSASSGNPTAYTDGSSGTMSYKFAFYSRDKWNSPTMVAKGGDVVQVGPNQRAVLVSALNGNPVGTSYSSADGGGGSWLCQTDAPFCALSHHNVNRGSFHWIDGKLAAFTASGGTAGRRYVIFDSTGLPRRMRTMRHKMTSEAQFEAMLTKPSDTLRAWQGYSPLKVVSQGDSYTTGPMFWQGIVGDMLGIENWRTAGRGGTGVLWDNVNNANYGARWQKDVLDQNPDIVLIQLSQNDQNGIPGTYTAQAVADALGVLIDRTNAATEAEIIVVGVWNQGAALTSGNAYNIDIACEATCAAKGVAFIPWRDLLTNGGYVGSPSGSGSSLWLTEPDGTHPTYPVGHQFRADFVMPGVVSAVERSAN